MSLVAARRENETWREAVIRCAAPWGLERDALGVYDRLLTEGMHEAQAAWCALYEWDIVDLTQEIEE